MLDFKKFFTRKNITIMLSVLAVILVGLTVIVCIKNSRVSSVVFESNNTSLIAIDSNSRKGLIKETGTAQFGFSQIQKECFLQVYEKSASAALVIRMEFTPTAAQKELLTTGTALPFNLGILYDYFENPSTAIILFNRAYVINKKDYEALYYMIKCYILLGDNVAANFYASKIPKDSEYYSKTLQLMN